MFGFKKEKAESKKFLNESDFQAENIPIHTMARDLESFNQPEAQSENDLQENAPLPEIKIKSPAEQAGASPFLPNRELLETPGTPVPKPKIESFVKTISTPLPEKEDAPAPAREIMDIPEGSEQANDQKKKIVFISMIVLLIIFFSAGGYYYWSTRNGSRVQPENTSPQETAVSQKPAIDEKTGNVAPVNPAPAKFSKTERNYFMLDLGDTSNASFKQLVQNYFNEISNSKIYFPVEFTLIDTGNTPVDFKTFAQKVGIKFSPELVSSLNDDFNFYIYNDYGNPGVGLALSVKGQMNPEEILLREETNLASELGPIFPVPQYVEVRNSPFSTGEYDSAKWGKVGIRFRNLTAPENLSVDYAFVNTGKDMLFIGTTKNTLRAIVDNVNMGVSGH
jgi:hypothetical protein